MVETRVPASLNWSIAVARGDDVVGKGIEGNAMRRRVADMSCERCENNRMSRVIDDGRPEVPVCQAVAGGAVIICTVMGIPHETADISGASSAVTGDGVVHPRRPQRAARGQRSEEHTSELQSRE